MFCLRDPQLQVVETYLYVLARRLILIIKRGLLEFDVVGVSVGVAVGVNIPLWAW